MTTPLTPTVIGLTPLASVTGGSLPVVVVALVLFAVAAVLALLVTYRLVRGYQQTRSRPHLQLAVGVFLLATGPLLIRIVASNLPTIAPGTRIVAASLSELAGLLVILYTIHR